MSPVTASAVQALRARTGVSILACKQALEEANGDQELAIEILRKRGIAQAVKKADRDQTEGAIFVSAGDGKAALVQLKCETDFVARSDAFIEMGQMLADMLLKEGKEKTKAHLESILPEAIQKLGENIGVGDLHEMRAEEVGTYVHSNRKIGVLVGIDPSTSSGQASSSDAKQRAKDVAMHAAAMNPLYINPEDIAEELLMKEKEIWKEQLKGDKKPEAILEKILFGKEKKFREENALAKQPFVKDSSITIEEYLGGAKIKEYVRVSV